MIIATVTGNLGRDAELKDVAGQRVCSFSVASTRKVKGSDETTWIDASIWGQRGDKLAQYLSKGTKVTIVGQLSTREHNGKTYLQLNVSDLDFAGGGRQTASTPAHSAAPTATATEADYGTGSDDIPF
jgi:single-strand DNA-binding protein